MRGAVRAWGDVANISSAESGRLSARPSQSLGDGLGAMLPRRERRGGGTVESTQVDRAEGPKREKRAGPFKLPARGVQAGASGLERAGEASLKSRGEACRSFQATGARRSSGSKWPGAGRRGKLTEPKGPAAKQGGQGEANGQLLGLWLYDLCLAAGNFALPGVPRNALLCS